MFKYSSPSDLNHITPPSLLSCWSARMPLPKRQRSELRKVWRATLSCTQGFSTSFDHVVLKVEFWAACTSAPAILIVALTW